MDPATKYILDPDPPFWSRTSWIQLGYGVWVNLTMIGLGMALGFPAVTIPQLLEKDSPIEITTRDEAMIASVLTLSAPIGSLICGVLMDRYGRKALLVMCEVPMCCGCLYAGFAENARDLIIGRIISGVSVGMMMNVPSAYVTEITLPNMRGVVGALPNLATVIGISIEAGLGSFLRWYFLCYIGAIYSVVLGFSKLFLPETPYFIMLSSSAANARKTLQRFRSARFNVDAEVNELRDYKTVNDIRRLTVKEHIMTLFTPAACKPFGIVIGYILIMQICGVNVITTWAIEMLEKAESAVDPHLGNFAIIGVTRMVFGVMTSILLFKVGRRPMALTSAIGVALISLLLGGFLHTNQGVTIYPLVFFICYVAFSTLGYYNLPFLMTFELLPLQVRGILGGAAISVLNLVMFGMNQIYPIMRDEIGLAHTIIFFGGVSLMGSIFLYFLLPETKNVTLQEIEEYFNSRRPTLVSQRQVMSMQLQSKSSAHMKTSVNLKIHSDDGGSRRESRGKDGKKRKRRDDKDDTRPSSSAATLRDYGAKSYSREK